MRGTAMFRRTGIVSMTCLGAFLLSGATGTQSCAPPQSVGSIGPSKGEIIGASVGVVAVVVVGTVVLVEVHNSHHTIKGCVFSGPSGLQVQDMNNTHIYRSEEHTSELQSLRHLVCRLLLEK